MASFTKAKRQAIIDAYLNATGENYFHPAAFIDWLAGQPENEAYPWFFGKDDQAAAYEYRVGLARQMASGLRIVARVEETRGDVVSIKVREYPALISPVANRKGGGGYEQFDPVDAAQMAELQRQGRSALRGWLARYGGAFAAYDLAPLEELAADIAPSTMAG